MKKIYLILITLVLSIEISYSQNDPQFRHYMYSETAYNPAMAGVTNTLDAALIVREQWIGFDDAPGTQFFNGSLFVNKMSGGVGLSLINDKLGFENSLNLKLMYAYQIRLTDLSKLSFGLGFGMLHKSLKGSKLIYDNMDDPNGLYVDATKTKPDFDFGVAYNSDKLTIGASITHIDQSIKKATVLKAPRHYYLMAKYKIKASEKINIIPCVKFKSAEFISQIDMTALLVFSNKFWIGGAYSTKDAMVGMIGMKITKGISIGYAYDYNTGGVKSLSDGSHEFMLLGSFDVARKIIPVKTPRFFD
ncbi:MAG TPA: type IX secretion system membrane protein PorP/SprF [Bacteroidales bacterium]|nr:type IX secretion system membrane protein PorP/SprF [Bacteroidales bacterium]HPS45779.1 type IX secretion system membrane protein PorP/SprF [Bacteroidales bacterium]HQI45127.1 type IX secretion system membrane protein PorP/SprF [Bacteroidales bacterium]